MAPQKCTLCNSTPATGKEHMKCAGCKSAIYCCTACQTLDWKYHKHVCKQYFTFVAEIPRPSLTHRLALLFPAEKANPEFVWIQFGPGIVDPDVRGILDWNVETLRISERLADANPYLQRFNFDHELQMLIRECGQYDGSKSNICVQKLMKGAQKYNWKGPLVVLSQHGDESDDRDYYQDIKPSDLRIIVDWFTSYGDGTEGKLTMRIVGRADLPRTFSNLFNNPAANGNVKAVKITSLGDMHFLGAKKYMEVEIERNHAIFSMQPTDVSKAMGIPFMIRKCNQGSPWSEVEHLVEFNPDWNKEAILMNITTDLTGDKFGWVDLLEWDFSPIGTVLVARQDRMKIAAHQVEALAAFHVELVSQISSFRETLNYLFDNEENYQDVKGQENAKLDFMKTHMCKDNFEEFFNKYKKEKVQGGDSSWSWVLSPYDS